MGFFIGWRYFEDKDYYSFEAQAERNRLRDQKKAQQLKEEKKARKRAEKKRKKKEELKRKWQDESAEYFQDQFGLRKDSFDFEYINSDIEEYKNSSQQRYGSMYHSSDEKQAPNLDRGLGAAPSMKVKRQGAKHHSETGQMGRLNKRKPVGMNPVGMEKNECVQNKRSSVNANRNTGRIGSSSAIGSNGKLPRPL